jgi:hypothetical protein
MPEPHLPALHDVSALILDNGEPQVARAIEGLEKQSVALRDTIRIGPEIRPLHRAFNAGVARIRTDFFIQVDADMVLDPSCLEILLSCIDERVGMVSGLLRDPILGRIMGVQLFRTQYVRDHPYGDSIVPESDFSTAMQQAQWWLVCALAPDSPHKEAHTVGLHDPAYTFESTFAKFLVTGAQLRARGAGHRARTFLQQILRSPHDCAVIAAIAAARGFTLAWTGDPVRPVPTDREIAWLDKFLNRSPGDSEPEEALLPAEGNLRGLYEAGRTKGHELYLRNAGRNFVSMLQSLADTLSIEDFALAVGLCSGLFRELDRREPMPDRDYRYENLETLLG